MRQFIRHPTSIPLDFSVEDQQEDARSTYNISEGGVSFICNHKIEVGAAIKISIKTIKPDIELVGRVVWNNKLDTGGYLVGVKFTEDEHYRARMVEQVCYIEDYRNKVLQEEGRELSSEEAANEWISRYASRFPD
jgi:hypothetical protein